MRCPLRLKLQKRGLGTAAFGVPDQSEDFDFCLENECQWWDAKIKNCIVHRLADKETAP